MRPPHLHASVYLMLRKGASVLLARRAGTGFRDGFLSLPGGHLEPGEQVLAAAVREAREECGIYTSEGDWDIRTVLHRPSYTPGVGTREYMDFFCEANAHAFLAQIRNAEPHKCSGLEFFPVDDLPADTLDFVRVGIDRAVLRVPFPRLAWSKGGLGP